MTKRELSERRRMIINHNALSGYVGMAKANMMMIAKSPTATNKAKADAINIVSLLTDLATEVKTRKEY